MSTSISVHSPGPYTLFLCTTLVLFMCTTLVLFVCTTLVGVVFMCTTLVLFTKHKWSHLGVAESGLWYTNTQHSFHTSLH